MREHGNPDDSAATPSQPWPDPRFGTERGAATGPAPQAVPYSHHDFAQAAPLATTPTPYDIAASHEPVFVYATATATLGDPSALLTAIFDQLAREASSRGCDRVYGVHHTFTINDGVMYATAAATGFRPIVDMDAPPAP